MLGQKGVARGGGVGFAAFRSVNSDVFTNLSGNFAVNKPSGLQLGDIVVILCFAATSGAILKTASTGQAFNRVQLNGIGSGVNQAVLFWKVMSTAADISGASGDTFEVQGGASSGGCVALAYIPNGATGVAVRSSVADASGQSSLVLSAFQPTGYGAAVLFADRDPDVTPAITPNFFAQRFSAVVASFYTMSAWDLIDYNGGNVTVSSIVGAGNFAECGFLLEFT